MKIASYKLTIIFALFLIITQVACILFVAPVRSIPDSEKFVALHQVPEMIKKYEIGSFSIKTSAGNLCSCTIIYDTYEREETKAIDLPELKANADGICQWDWKVPLDAKTGTAVFIAAAEQNGIYDSIGPFTFCIEKCPWTIPTNQP